MATNDKKVTTVTVERRSSKDSLEVRTPRTARFAEATSVYSPVDPPRSPVESPPHPYKPQPQITDTGFGFMQQPVEMEETDRRYLPPPTPKTPLKSALKSPGAPPRTPAGAMSIMSPTFREEEQLEKREAMTDKEQAKDFVCTSIAFSLQCQSLTVNRKSRSAYGWQRSSYEVSTLPAVLSSSP
jgi:hypothetical protein